MSAQQLISGLKNRSGYRPSRSISSKIVLPYLLLTLIVAAVGAFVVTRLVSGSLQERFDNQLLDAGRVTSELMVESERERLELLRAVGNTRGVPEALAAGDANALAGLVPQLVTNNRKIQHVSLVGTDGVEQFGWYQSASGPGNAVTGTDFSTLEDVTLVLQGYEDSRGIRRVALHRTAANTILYTVGPVYDGDQMVGVVLVGNELNQLARDLTEAAVARVTLYDPAGTVLATGLGSAAELQAVLPEPSSQYEVVRERLQASSPRYDVVIAGAADQVLVGKLSVFDQDYLLAYGDWRVRDKSLGFFSVALPSNFILSAAATSRNQLALVFSLATVGVFTLGFFIARQLTSPLHQLVTVSAAVADGNLQQRTGIERHDEIGTLARSFDTMTARLATNHRQLVAERSNLAAVLQSIADGVLVFDREDNLVNTNPMAERFLQDMHSSHPGEGQQSQARAILEDLRQRPLKDSGRFYAGSRIFSGSVAPVRTPADEQLGWVVILHDVTRTAEAEQLKDNFITSISHELRSPLTSIKGYTDILEMTAAPVLDARQKRFIEIIQDNTTRLIGHVTKLIDMAEIHSGTLSLRKTELSLAELCRETGEAWQERMTAKGLDYQLDLDADRMWVSGDKERLAWALDNLLRNACDYTLAGGQVSVRMERRDGVGRIEITDSGRGISASDQPHIFERFYRAEVETTFDVYGLGLGLFITRAIIEGHDGSVAVESKLGAGSTFYVTIPLLSEQATSAATETGTAV